MSLSDAQAGQMVYLRSVTGSKLYRRAIDRRTVDGEGRPIIWLGRSRFNAITGCELSVPGNNRSSIHEGTPELDAEYEQQQLADTDEVPILPATEEQ